MNRPPPKAKLLELGVDELTALKTADILHRSKSLNETWKLSGFVLCNEKGERCIIEKSAVRWLNKDDAWKVMHPE